MNPTPLQRYVLVKELRYPDTTHRFYYVGKLEGWSCMSTIAYIFQTTSDHTHLLKEITTFYDNIEIELLKSPSAVRSILVYPQAISQDWNL